MCNIYTSLFAYIHIHIYMYTNIHRAGERTREERRDCDIMTSLSPVFPRNKSPGTKVQVDHRTPFTILVLETRRYAWRAHTLRIHLSPSCSSFSSCYYLVTLCHGATPPRYQAPTHAIGRAAECNVCILFETLPVAVPFKSTAFRPKQLFSAVQGLTHTILLVFE